jgi:hypothetical protein
LQTQLCYKSKPQLSFELIDRRNDFADFVVAKLRMAGKGKTLFGVRLGVRKTARVAADAFTASLPMCWNWIMNQGFDLFLVEEVRQAISFRATDNEQIVNMTLTLLWR